MVPGRNKAEPGCRREKTFEGVVGNVRAGEREE